MSSNSSKTPLKLPWLKRPQRLTKRQLLMVIGLPLWVFFGFMLSQALTIGLVWVCHALGVPLQNINPIIFNVIAGIFIYALAILIVAGLPWLLKKRRTTKEELGFTRWPHWMDIAWAIGGFIGYMILSGIITTVAQYVLTFVNFNQAQDTGYSGISTSFEYVLAFISLVIIAPLSEEILFRGYLFGKLQKYVSVGLSVFVTSLLFGIVHLQWNVGLDVFALSLVLCFLRLRTNSIWASVFLHMTKNTVAFFFLFINPHFLSTLVR